ncbi:tRNA (adenine-N1)-methyltransferase [Sulfurihydrogenibium subterraneum]|uniref:tRNA (adenine-N1)-methyltransferase n=1 Tax=Sulfurihydrogenibium subterraneum TaxID=171121 RepID=UPI00048FBFE6|nr:tRNA (adenine-N1)-methyltransferase [Sulfurihydrogenibium subterraneum]
MIKEGDTVHLKGKKDSFFVIVEKDKEFSTHKGTIKFNDIIGKNFGDTVLTHKGEEFLILRPTLYELIMYGIKRYTQIIYPKDSAYITLKLGLTSGMKVLESGIGSGALTMVMANALNPDGKIYVYEKEEKFLKNALNNLKLAKLDHIVIPHLQDLSQPIQEKDFDAAFIDVKEPWLYIENVKSVLKEGAVIGFLVPTTNQVVEILKELKRLDFLDLEVEEILLRSYKPVPDRLRPDDRMVAHTGYLIFAKNG